MAVFISAAPGHFTLYVKHIGDGTAIVRRAIVGWKVLDGSDGRAVHVCRHRADALVICRDVPGWPHRSCQGRGWRGLLA